MMPINLKKRRGITPVLSVLILIGIALVGGTLLNSYFQVNMIQSFDTLEYRVIDLQLVKNSDATQAPSCFFSIDIYNSGTNAITKTGIKTVLDSGTDWNGPENFPATDIINPGQSLKFSRLITNTTDPKICQEFTVGNTYVFRINATASDLTSTFTTLKSVTVEEVDGI